jgi:CubicO group peptidase (beta-lactamase class C family)
VTEPRRDELSIWHLVTHTGGLTYGFMGNHPVDELYRRAGLEWGTPRGADLEAVCDLLADLPLLFQPGAEWAYSMGIDVLGRVIEVVSGQRLDEFFAERIFGPLGMVDTGFHVPEDQQHRLAALYMAEPGSGQTTRLDVLGRHATRPPVFLSGGGGVVSTASDYHRFMQLLAGRGELDGVRLLAPRTVRYLASNHLPGGVDLARFGRPIYAETSYDGVGFGLGVSVTIDPVAAKVPGSIGDYGWGGLASTVFWVDPYEDLTVLFLTQLVPSSAQPLRSRLRQLVYQTLVG